MLVVRTTSITSSAATQPARAAPNTRTSGAFEPVSMNASTMPGSAAWLTASPRRLCRRSTANAPSMPATRPMAAEPRATVRRE